jgi:NAD(P)H-dependent FMN reductase
LKNAIDSVYNEWDRKPVAFVGYGTYGATRAVEQLVDIAAKVGLVPLSKTFVGLLEPWNAVLNGEIKEEYVRGNVEGLLENLQWWTDTLKAAR